MFLKGQQKQSERWKLDKNDIIVKMARLSNIKLKTVSTIGDGAGGRGIRSPAEPHLRF